MASWVNDIIRSTHRITQIKAGGPSSRGQAQVASELCAMYKNLLIDPEFKQHMDKVISADFILPPVATHRRELHCHLSEAIALLVEAGMDSDHALDAVHSVDELILSNGRRPESENFYKDLRDVRQIICNLSDHLWSDAGALESRSKLRNGVRAGAGLALTGLAGAALAALGLPIEVAAGGAEALKTVGTTIFDHNSKALFDRHT